MNVENLEKRVRHYISLRHEGETWDFKRQWYAKDKGKADLLHDIICMANTIENEDGLIIIGVDEENGYTIRDVQEDSNRKDTQKIVDFLGNKHFDGDVKPKVRVESLIIDEKTIDVIVVENSINVPFYLRERIGNVQAYHIYTRVGDSNTPVDKSADRDRVEALWQKRFEIDKTAIEKFQKYLKDINGWESVDGGQTFFYKLYPEYQIKIEINEEKDANEYFCFSQLGREKSWWSILLKLRDMTIQHNTGISLSKGDFFTVTPWDYFMLNGDLFYCYVEGSLWYDLNNFCFQVMNHTNYDSKARWDECIPIFRSEYEKADFVKFLKTIKLEPVRKYDACIPDKLPNGEEGANYRRLYSLAIAITEALNEYRRQKGDDI